MVEIHMNKHFDDSRYYLKRAGEHAKLGVTETVKPYTTRLRELIGRDSESDPEPDRLDAVRNELTSLEQKAVGRVHGVTGNARSAVFGGRSSGTVDDQ